MNELTTLLQELASKLGTTTEYLWGVMIKQAPINAITNTILIVVTFLLIIPYVRYIKWFSKNHNDLYDKDHDIVHWVVVVTGGVTLCTLIVLSVCEIGNVVTAFLNPEYLALDQILNKI